MTQSTSGKEKSYESLETLHLSAIRPNVLGSSPSSDPHSVLQSLMRNIYSRPKDQFNFSVVIKRKGLSGTLSITWTPTASPRRGVVRAKPSNKSTTSDM